MFYKNCIESGFYKIQVIDFTSVNQQSDLNMDAFHDMLHNNLHLN